MADLSGIIESARRLGIELDEDEAAEWLRVMSAPAPSGDMVLDPRRGVYGHWVTMLDFSPEELERFRAIGSLVEIPDRPGEVETALALSGSAAQSRIQTYPGDCDFFERVNIVATTREGACEILADLMRQKVLATSGGDDHRFTEAKFGSYPAHVVRGGETIKAGSPITWTLDEVRAGAIEAEAPDGSPVAITWEEAARDPGWCKLDWIVADPFRERLANASNMLDVTWESPEGQIVPLDGMLDAYYQEVYLEAASVPIFSKVTRGLLPDALDDYVRALEGEVRKHVHDPANYGKAAKRMYNVFRFSGRYREAAYIRELFDEPAAALYQVAALIRTVDEASAEGSAIDDETVLGQLDALIDSVRVAMTAEEETKVLEPLARLRESLEADEDPARRVGFVHDAREEVEREVNEFFLGRLTELEEIRDYLESLKD